MTEAPTTTPAPQCTPVDVEDRFNCNPEDSATEQSCLDRGCCWQPESDSSNSKVPSCYFPDNYQGYTVKVLSQTPVQILAQLSRVRNSGFPDESKIVILKIDFLNENLIRVKLTDPEVRQWEVIRPDPIEFTTSDDPKKFLYDVELNEGILQISRKSSGTILIKSDLKRLIYAKQFMQIDWSLPAKYIYGLSEHKTAFRQNVTWSKYTIFNRGDQPTDAYRKTGLNLYGKNIEI